PAYHAGDRCQRGVGVTPVRVGRYEDLGIDEHEAVAPVLVDAQWNRGALESGVSHRTQNGVDRTRVRIRGAKNMRTDADELSRVRDPASELLLSHTATLADGWCSRRRGRRARQRGDRR